MSQTNPSRRPRRPSLPSAGPALLPRRAALAAFAAAILLTTTLAAGAAAQTPGDSTTPDASESASSPRASWRGDGFPLQPTRDAAALREIWSELDEYEARGETGRVDKASTLQLQKQGPGYRGRILAVEGRLLRGERVALSPTEAFYDLWILLPDTKRDPIRLLTRDAPDGFAPDAGKLAERAGDRSVEYRHETLRAVAEYYRTTAYDAGDDFLAAPTLVGTRFTLSAPDAQGERSGSGKPRGGTLLKFASLALAAALWVVWRSGRRRVKKSAGASRDGRFGGSGGAALTLAFLAGIAWAAPCAGAESEGAEEAGSAAVSGNAGGPENVNENASAQFWGGLPGASPEGWSREQGRNRPGLAEGTPASAERRAIALAILGLSERALSEDVLRGRVVLGDVAAISGTLEALEPIPLTASEEERVGTPTVYRATIADASGRAAAVYVPHTPSFTAPAGFFDAPRAAAPSPGLGEHVGALGIRFGAEGADGSETPSDASDTPSFLATRLSWRPTDAPLGRLGADLAAFESVPVWPHDALERTTDRTEREQIAKSMRWTTADRRAFYGSLAAYSGTARGSSAAEEKREPANVVSLFNEPEKQQGSRVRLAGWVRRVNMVLVSDPEVKAATGLERYYQLFLFTNESQGWPITLCVPDLPDGLEVGGSSKYRREVEFDGFFYKTWVYKATGGDATLPSAEESEEGAAPETGSGGAVGKWTRSPVVVGRIVKVVPEEEKADSGPWTPGEIFIGFALLACAWVALRLLVRRDSGSAIERIKRRRRELP